MQNERSGRRLEHEETSRQILREHAPDRAVWLFGSRAGGEAKSSRTARTYVGYPSVSTKASTRVRTGARAPAE